MKQTEETKKLSEEAAQEQKQAAVEESEEERAFWLSAKYADAPYDSDR